MAVSASSWLVACCACSAPSAPWLRATIVGERLRRRLDVRDDLACTPIVWRKPAIAASSRRARRGHALVAAERLVEVLREELAELLVELVDPEVDALRLAHQPVDLLQRLL